MARSIINNSDSGLNIRNALNAMTAELFGGVQGLLGGRRARIATIGNSHATSQGLVPAIMYSLWRYYPADVYFDYRVQQSTSPTGAEAFDPTKGDVFAVGGSTTTQMVNLQLPRLQAAVAAGRVYDLLYIGDGGYNDQYTTAAAVATGVANIITVANAALAAGVRLVVILGVMPAGAGTGSYELANYCAEANQRLANFAAATPGVAFQELTSLFADHNNTSANLNKRFGNVYQGYTVDGVHLSGFGTRLLAPELAKYHRAIARPRIPRVFGNTGTFSASNLPSINVLGNAGNMQGTSGIKNSNPDTGVAGVSSNSRIFLSDAGNGNNVATPSIIVGADGFTRQRITMSGAAAASGVASLSWSVGGISDLNGGVLTRAYDAECIIELTGVTGLSNISLRTANRGSSDTPGAGGTNPSDLWSDNTTETLFVYSTVPETFSANFAPGFMTTLNFSFTNRIPAGTIDVSRMSVQKVTAE